ncbi:MAG: hypothetical protein AB7D57_07875 [Desulfovibrionaceae bacterium]
MIPFKNDDERLRREVARVAEERTRLGLDGLVGGLECVVVNTEADRLRPAVQEFLATTGYAFRGAFEDASARSCLLQQEGSADFLIQCRKGGDNPFRAYNRGPKSDHLPDTRLETFIYKCPRLEDYVAIQQARGVRFLTPEIVETDTFLFIQTEPSPYTGNSVGFVKWLGEEGAWAWEGCAELPWTFTKPDWPHLRDIHELDHTATRVRAEDRDAAILEFMRLTNYDFDFAVYVESLNSITNVARLSAHDYAQVFTSGIGSARPDGSLGPTEQYIANYNVRVHHMAFRTERIERAYQALKAHGMGFLVELVGGPDEGLHQTFSKASPNTLLVNEYIQRYDGFDGFFTKSNVTLLTKATEQQ